MFQQFRQQSILVHILWALLLAAAGAAALEGRWSLSFVALATLALALAPIVMASRLDVTLPMPFVVATTVFVIASIFMGEAFDFYERVWWWDIALHGLSAIGFGLIGFVFVLTMFEGDRFAAPPWALCLLAFGLAITVGVFWEIFEFLMDLWFGFNMQKSGLSDTMGDMIVDVIGAGLATWAGYAYLHARGRKIWTWPIDQFVSLNKRLFRKDR